MVNFHVVDPLEELGVTTKLSGVPTDCQGVEAHLLAAREVREEISWIREWKG